MDEEKLKGLIERADTLEKAEQAEEWMLRQSIPAGTKDKLLGLLRRKMISLMVADARHAIKGEGG